MFYTIKKVDEHPCNDMQKVLKVFFKELLTGNAWDIDNQHEIVKRIHASSTFPSSLQLLHNDLIARNEIIRHTLYKQFVNNNNILELCNNTLELDSFFHWDIDIGKKIKDFMLSCYPTKLDLSVFRKASCSIDPTKSFYQDFIERNGYVCPFCSILPHKHPFGKKRGDFDHFILKDKYPLAALNINNLIPMCTECNQDYKHMDNILINEYGDRRKFIYPYDLKEPLNIKINSLVFSEKKWKYDISIIHSDLEEEVIRNYDKVFKVESRIKRELTKNHDSWLVEEAKRYVSGSTTITIIGFKSHLLNIANNVIDLRNRILAAKLLESSLYRYLGTTVDYEIDNIFLPSYLARY